MPKSSRPESGAGWPRRFVRRCRGWRALLAALTLLTAQVYAATPKLEYVVVIMRHGVRSPTWDGARLRAYASASWPDFGVAPGELTSQGRTLITLLGAYYRAHFAALGLLAPAGCADAGQIQIHVDNEQRTLETGRTLAAALAPGCGVVTHAAPAGEKDPLFADTAKVDSGRAAEELRHRMGDPQSLLAAHRAALDRLQFILSGGRPVGQILLAPPAWGVSASAKGAVLNGPFSTGSTLSEDLLLEYTDGMSGADLGWGRLNPGNLAQVLEIHSVYADLTRRTPYIAAAGASNLLAHVLASIEQAASGAPVAGALGSPGDRLLVLVGHDTNQSNVSGMLGLTWQMAGYPPVETPPGGALIFSLWRDGKGAMRVTCDYAAQTPAQMHDLAALDPAHPPPQVAVAIPGCPADGARGCPWADFERVTRQAILPGFVH